MANEPPHLVVSHQERLFLASGIHTQLSPINRISGWNTSDKEYFQEGGGIITGMVSHERFLVVFKESAISAIVGNSHYNWGKDKLVDASGSLSHDSGVSDRSYVLYEDSNGRPSMLFGNEFAPVADQISRRVTDNRGADGLGACHPVPGNGIILLHRGGGSVGFWCDPEALKRDQEDTDWMVPWFPFELPGTVDASWSRLDKRPLIVVGSTFYVWGTPADSRSMARARMSMYNGGDPGRSSVRRIAVDASFDPGVDMLVSVWREGAVTADASATTPSGRVSHTVPAIGTNVELVEIQFTEGVSTLQSVTFDEFVRTF